MSQLSKYGAVEVAEAPAATPRRARGVVLALSLLVGGALFAVAGPGPSPRLRGTQLDSYWTIIGGTPTQVETDAEGLEVVIATMENGEVCPSGNTDSYGNCVDEGCASWFDGCNTCNVGTDGVLACTRMACEKDGEAKCLDTPQIVGGPGDDDHDCCGGGSACGWGWCEAQGKCTQVWECEPDPTIEVGNATTLPAPATTPGVVNYFDTVAKPANTDCNGGESVGVGCASGTTLSTENEYSGKGEDMGKGVKTSTATTVEEANAADKPSTKTPIINSAAGPSPQSESDCTGSGCIITTGGVAAPRDGAGDVKYIPGRK